MRFYPALPSESKFNQNFSEESLSDIYQEFLERFDSVVYISFGTSFMPPYDQLMTLISMIRHMNERDSSIGFIFSLKERHVPQAYKEI